MYRFALLIVAATLLTSSISQAASYKKTDGAIVDPIMDQNLDPHSYSGANLEPYANLSYANLSYANPTSADLHRAKLYRRETDLHGPDRRGPILRRPKPRVLDRGEPALRGPDGRVSARRGAAPSGPTMRQT